MGGQKYTHVVYEWPQTLTFSILDCGCSINSRINPICAKDDVTSYYSPCLAGCKSGSYNKTSRIKSYSNCSCIADRWETGTMTLSKDWILKGPLKNTENPDMSVIKTAQTHSKSTINSEAIGGWCPVDCSTQFKIFGITMFLLGVLGTYN